MNSDIENLINIALADGEITDKERSIILRKAEKIGQDIEEVEMFIEAKIHLSKKPKTKEKVGNIKVCPACGENIQSLMLNCPSCGHEMTNKESNKSINKLLSKLENAIKLEDDLDIDETHARIISNFPIPIVKEDLYEFILFSRSKLGLDMFEDDIAKAWRKKLGESIGKAIISFPKSSDEYQQIIQFNEEFVISSKKQKKKEIYGVVISITILITIAVLVILFG
jgi:predicted RNA-binding Zn-ribbon protein involved in translation (DUF1610 family)